MTIAVMLLMSFAASAQVTVTVYLTDNTTAAVEVDASGQLYFTEDDLTVVESALTGTTSVWALDDISKVTFEGDVTTEGIDTPTECNTLTLYPNPTQQSFAVSGIGETPTVVTVYNVAGVKMLEQRCTEGATIDVSGLTRGIYFVRVGTQTLKLAKR